MDNGKIDTRLGEHTLFLSSLPVIILCVILFASNFRSFLYDTETTDTVFSFLALFCSLHVLKNSLIYRRVYDSIEKNIFEMTKETETPRKEKKKLAKAIYVAHFHSFLKADNAEASIKNYLSSIIPSFHWTSKGIDPIE
ncbi:hypothetical protein N9948_01990 [bacterium]|nr:hypothetical protein [bacterium]